VNVIECSLPGVVILEAARHGDERGFFLETFKAESYRLAGLGNAFVQDNWSRSKRHVLRGLHYQRRQGKLLTVVRGEVYDVAVDIRPDSETFGKWVGMSLSEENHRQLFVPPGFAHGFCVVSELADVWYKTTDVYRPEHEGGVRWNDPALGIDWPIESPILSERDRHQPLLKDIPPAALITREELALEAQAGPGKTRET
jgi:dTDP-4-dehydrorhamnose 3,5-epimerase